MTWHGKPHPVGDRGQRYEITFLDADGVRKTLGWTGDADGAEQMANVIRSHPTWDSPAIIDRQQPSREEGTP